MIGERVVIHNNSVIGCDGFGYAKDEQKRWLKIPQTGRVVIEDDVEIGAATTIDRASVGESRIGRGTKLDNLVQIGHSCTVGEDSLLCAQVGLAGSSHIGNRVILAGQAGVAGHLTIGDDVVLTAKSATSHDIPAGKVISGIPAFDNRDWLRSTAAFRRLGEMQRTVRELERRIKATDDTDKRTDLCVCVSPCISVLSDRAAIDDHDLAVHKTVALAHHERGVFGELFGAAETSG